MIVRDLVMWCSDVGLWRCGVVGLVMVRGVEVWLSDVVCWFCGGWGRGFGFLVVKFVWCGGSEVVVYGGVVSYLGCSVM